MCELQRGWFPDNPREWNTEKLKANHTTNSASDSYLFKQIWEFNKTSFQWTDAPIGSNQQYPTGQLFLFGQEMIEIWKQMEAFAYSK